MAARLAGVALCRNLHVVAPSSVSLVAAEAAVCGVGFAGVIGPGMSLSLTEIVGVVKRSSFSTDGPVACGNEHPPNLSIAGIRYAQSHHERILLLS